MVPKFLQMTDDPKVFDNPQVLKETKVVSNGSLDFDNPKVFDGLVTIAFKIAHSLAQAFSLPIQNSSLSLSSLSKS